MENKEETETENAEWQNFKKLSIGGIFFAIGLVILAILLVSWLRKDKKTSLPEPNNFLSTL